MSENADRVTLPRLYPILDAEALARAGVPLRIAAEALREAGTSLVQYRDKQGSDASVLSAMGTLRTIFPRGEATLLLNDRAHLYAPAEADGVHLGQQDMPVTEARRLLGPRALLGVSTHNEVQLHAALATGAADYVAIGPVFPTSSKQNPDAVVGLEGVARARTLTTLPLVAIGGITPESARRVLQAGADAVALISALLPPHEAAFVLTPDTGRSLTERVRDILSLLR